MQLIVLKWVSDMVYEIPQNGRYIPKYVGMVNGQTIRHVCNLCIDLIL